MIIRSASPTTPESRALIHQLDLDLSPRYPGRPIHGIDVTEFERTGGHFVVATEGIVFVGCGAFRPLWGWLAIDPTTYAVTSVLSTGENGAAETSILDVLHDAESYGIGFYLGVDSSVWSVAAFTLAGLPYAEVLNQAEEFAKKAAENFSGIGVEPKEVAKALWKKFSLLGSEYMGDDPSWRKFSDGYNAGVKYYFDKARQKP